LVAWDLALDPAMSRLTPYWVWGASGPYFGMPLSNLAGWALTGALLHAILVAIRADAWVDALSPATVRAASIVYAANFALPAGMNIVAGLPLAAVASLALMGFTILLARRSRVAESDPATRGVAPEVAG
jgi:putative membrane protein